MLKITLMTAAAALAITISTPDANAGVSINESGQRSQAIDELQSKILIAHHHVNHVKICLHKNHRGICDVWKWGRVGPVHG